MKPIVFLITFLTFTITCIGQTIEINQFGTSKLSRSSTQLSTSQITDFSKKKLHNSIPNPDLFGGNANVYNVGNVLISMNYRVIGRHVDTEKHLVKIKTALDALMRDDNTYSSKIETINNKKFLITSQHERGGLLLIFYGLNEATSTSLNGSVQCAPEDEAEANATLHELLSNLKFKVQ